MDQAMSCHGCGTSAAAASLQKKTWNCWLASHFLGGLLALEEPCCPVSVTFCHKSTLGSVSLKVVVKFPYSSVQMKQIQRP